MGVKHKPFFYLLVLLLSFTTAAGRIAADSQSSAIQNQYATTIGAQSGLQTGYGAVRYAVDQMIANPLPLFRTLHALVADNRLLTGGALLFPAMFVKHAAIAGLGLKQDIPFKIKDKSGIEIIRAAYGELNIVIRREQLADHLKNYASIAVYTYNKGVSDAGAANIQAIETYRQDARMLKDGIFDFEDFLTKHRLESTAKAMPDGDQLPLQLYSQFLLPEQQLLLDTEQESRFAYLIAFYDQTGKPLGFMQGDLPLLGMEMSDKPVIVALMYHHFSDKAEEINSVTVHPDKFREQLKLLKEKGFTAIRQQDLLAYMKGQDGQRLPAKSVLITMDDGYESNYKFAYPALVEEEMYGVIYAITSSVNDETEYLKRFTWEQAREMVQSGRMLIQSHTHQSHYYGEAKGGKEKAATVSPLIINGSLETEEQYEQRIREDIYTAKSLLEQHLATPVFSLAYPYGRHNTVLLGILQETGHELMYTVKKGVIRKGMDMTKLPRINVDGSYSAERMWKAIKKQI